MKVNYAEGTWFAVPLSSGGFGVGVAARATKKGPVILAYLFGPRRETVPVLSEVAELEPSMAVKVAMIGDLSLINGEWPILGRLSQWRRGNWPIPLFVRSSELSRRAYIVRYDDKDPGRAISEEPVEYGTSTLDRDSAYGAGAVESTLTRLLSSQDQSEKAESSGPGLKSDQSTEPHSANTNAQKRSEEMDAWQAAIFAGDNAADWLGELTDPEQIREALATVVEAPKDEYLEVSCGGAALAAAEIVAACCGRPAKNLPEDAMEWVSAHPGLGKKRLIALAQKAVRRVETSSEVQQSFDESELKDAWHSVVKDLLSRLA